MERTIGLMNTQNMYSLAIQALNDYKEVLSRRPLIDAYDISRNDKWIREAEEAIEYFEKQKELSLVLGGFPNCDVSFHIVDKDCGNLPNADGIFEE